ncbi:MAG: beta-ketoacyl synthase N-terminal-like domain-containing protein [Bacteroidota bacterium]
MTKVFIEASNIITSLGFSTKENLGSLLNGETGIKMCSNTLLSPKPFPASFIDDGKINDKFQAINTNKEYTRFEKLSILSVQEALKSSVIDLTRSRTLFILSSTKGNVELLDDNLRNGFPKERLNLHTTAKIISGFFNINNPPVVVSNACISGIAAIITGQRLISQGLYDHVIVNGTDVLSKFVVSGFQSFLSLSAKPCKPFDANRDGLTLGEGSATIILTKNKYSIEIVNGATSNDANHISGPSRTGEGLLIAINKAKKNYKNIDLLSAHGTATPYNDDMESKAITRAGLGSVPTNSLKGYFGHTLGAAGVIESIISLEALKKNILIKTVGCETPGTAESINIIQETREHQLNSLLKFASGFGGSNAAALFLKHE